MAVTKVATDGIDSSALIGSNLIINGAMTVAQRPTQTGQGNESAHSAVDILSVLAIGTPQARVTTSQDTSVPTGEGFGYSLKVDTTTAEGAVAAGEVHGVYLEIEAQFLQHLRYGNADAKELILQFWISSPKSGTHCVGLHQVDGSRSYVREFTVTSADTWEAIEVTFPGDTGGTINNDSGGGLRVSWPQIAGSNWQVSADAWASGFDVATSNQQNLLDNVANNFYLTGVQLEVGSVATDFVHEEYGTTLARCQRYAYVVDGDPANGTYLARGHALSSTVTLGETNFPVTMRGTPTLIASATEWEVADAVNSASAVTVIGLGSGTSIYSAVVSGTVGSGLTQYRPYGIRAETTGSKAIFSAEL